MLVYNKQLYFNMYGMNIKVCSKYTSCAFGWNTEELFGISKTVSAIVNAQSSAFPKLIALLKLTSPR